MSNKAMSWAVEIKTLPLTTKAVLMLLADCHNGSTGQCNPSMEWLQDRTGLKPRALQLHFRLLEESGFMDRTYVHHGRGKGCSVEQFTLKIGIMAAKKSPPKEALEAQDNADAKNCARKILPMRAQNIAHSYKEEPEENRKSIADSDFQTFWMVFPAQARGNSGKSKTRPVFGKIAKTTDPQILIAAARAYVSGLGDWQTTPCNPLRWLREERWMVFTEQNAPAADVDIEAWREAMRKFVDHGTWPAFLGPKPGEDDCRVPEGLLNHWKRIAS